MAVSIATKLILDNSDFIRKSKASQRSLKALDFTARKLASAFKFAVVSATALTVAFGALVLRQTALIDRIGKVTNVISLSTDTLQKFRFAAELAGVSTEQADVALRRFARRFGEAAKGTGELLPALRRLGIETRDSSGNVRDLEDVLFDFADGIKATDNETQQLALAFKAFDSEGAELVGTLKEGSDGLRDIFQIAEQFNLLLDKDLIKNAEFFRDALTLLTMQIGAMTNAVIAQLTPALSELIMQISVRLLSGLDNSEKKFKQLQRAVKDGKLSVVEFFGELKKIGNLRTFAVEIVNKILSVFNAFVTGFMKAINFLIPGMNLLLDQYTKIVRKMTDDPNFGLSDSADEARDSIAVLNKELQGMQEPFFSKLGNLSFVPKAGADLKRIAEIKKEIKELQGDLENTFQLELFTDEQFKAIDDFFNRYMDNYKGPPGGLIDQLLYGDKGSESVMQEIVVVGQRIEKSLGQKVLDLLFGTDRVDEFWLNYYSTGVGSLTKLGSIAQLVLGEQIFDNLREGLEAAGVGDFIKTMSEGLIKGAQMFEDALADAVVNGKADFSDLAAHLKQVLAKAMIQKFITGPIMGLFGLAKGGPAKAGQPYIVGEEGPELFVPKNSGTVVPNHALGNMSGGPGMGMGGQQVTYNINAVDTQSFQQALARDPEFLFNVTQKGARSLPSRG